MTIAPFPTDYQLDQIGKLVLVDRTRPWMLNKYFDAAHFRVVDKPMDQQTLFAELCQQLLEEGFVDAEFHASVVEREAIVSTMLGGWHCAAALPGAAGEKDGGLYRYRPAGYRPGATKPPISFSCSLSASASMKRRWRSTIFS